MSMVNHLYLRFLASGSVLSGIRVYDFLEAGKQPNVGGNDRTASPRVVGCSLRYLKLGRIVNGDRNSVQTHFNDSKK
jgi:hypothetical protein